MTTLFRRIKRTIQVFQIFHFIMEVRDLTIIQLSILCTEFLCSYEGWSHFLWPSSWTATGIFAIPLLFFSSNAALRAFFAREWEFNLQHFLHRFPGRPKSERMRCQRIARFGVERSKIQRRGIFQVTALASSSSPIFSRKKKIASLSWEVASENSER